MRKKTLSGFISILLFLAVARTQLSNSVRADPFMPSGSWSDEPIPPSIEVQSPSSKKFNYGTESDVWLNFTVTAPLTSWYSTSMNPYPESYATTFGDVTQVSFSLDRKPKNVVEQIYTYQGVSFFSVELGYLSVGRHNITIYAEGLARYGNLTHDIFVGSQYSINDGNKTKLVETSKDIGFIVASTTEPFLISLVTASIISMIVISVGLLVYFKKRKR